MLRRPNPSSRTCPDPSQRVGPSFLPRLLPLSLMVLVGPILGSCGRPPIRIGVMGSFSSPSGIPGRLGARLAVAQINATGGVNGRLLELVEEDDKGMADSAVLVASSLVNSDVVAVIGSGFSGPTLAAAPIFNGASDPVLQITPSGSSPDISEAGDWTFRTCPTDLAHAATLARFVRKKLQLDRGAVLYMNNAYGRGFRAVFEREFTGLGGTVVSADPYLAAQVQDAGPYVELLARDGKAQFIVAASYEPDGAELLRMVRARGITVPFLAGDGVAGLEREGPVTEGAYQTASYLANLQTPTNLAWVAQYRAAFPDQPPPSQMAVGFYDAVRLVARLIGEVGTDRRALRDALAQVGTTRPPFDGISGRIAFDSLGDVPDMRVLVGVTHNGVTSAVEGQ
ncbi:MAG TPA: ABC transporter substrate-binding protein [Gemmatimonadales bacterium]|nr:ABC transporter substrate-binding protein [Gemmatimonadales bacterium]